ASRLRYVGQSMQAGEILAVNAKRAEMGELHVAAINGQGFGSRIGSLVFEVKAADYASGLQFDSEILASVRNQRFQISQGAQRVRAAANLLVPADARVMGLADMRAKLGVSASLQMSPGQVPTGFAGLQFGNVNLSPANGLLPQVTVDDALLAIQASVGSQEMIVGTDVPDGSVPVSEGKDRVLAGNVSPSNLPGLGEPGDALPPGWESATDAGQVDVQDALEIILASVGGNQDVAGKVMPGRPAVVPACNAAGQSGGRVLVSGNITTNTTF